MKTHIFIALCLVILASSVLVADELDQKSRELQKLKQSRDKVKQERSTVLAKERGTLLELKDMDKQLAIKEGELRIYERNLEQCKREIEQLEAALTEAELRLKQTQAMMFKRLKAMYKFGYEGGQLSYLKLLLGADSISDLLNRYKYMSAIANEDRRLLERVIAEKSEIELNKKQVEERRERILFYKAGTERIRKEVLSKRETRRDVLNNLKKSKDQLTKTLSELEKSVRELENLIAQLRNTPQQFSYDGATNLDGQRGKLPWPVSGKIIENSAPSMEGVTIQAEYGTDIRCVSDGIVEYSRWFDGVGFGQMVIVNHGSGYRTLYAHASELMVKEGQKVKKGDIIAKVGDTGSIKGTILYFQIWKGTKALPTGQWLR